MTDTRTLKLDALCAALITIAVLIIAAPGLPTGGLGWSDAPQHAFDGVFILEFLKQMPLEHPRQWAEVFYLKHPALGIIVYWPPGFAAFEAVMFAVFGVSVVAARLTVLLFAVGAGLLMFALGRRWFDRPTGLLAALLLITCPHGALWMNDVMLEWPATFWVLAAVYAYQRDRESRRAPWSLLLGGAIIMAFLTKQTAAFIAPVIVIHALLAKDRRDYLLRPGLVISLAGAASVIVGYAALARPYSGLSSQLVRPSLDPLYYPAHLPEIIGWPLLPVALLGLVTLIIRPDRSARGLLLLWCLGWTALSSVIAAREPRYLFFSLPPLMFAAVRFLMPAPAKGEREPRLGWRRDAPRLVLLAVLVLVQGATARVKSTGRLPDYGAAVAALAERPDADLVLVDAVRDGQFVFDAYRHPIARERIIPLRASKLLYARPARVKWGYEQFVQSGEDIVALLDRYGIRYIVIESRLPNTPYTDADPPPRKMLRELLAGDPRFELLDAWPLRCGDPIWDDVELRLYAYPGCPPRASDTITLSIPGMGREVTFKLP